MIASIHHRSRAGARPGLSAATALALSAAWLVAAPLSGASAADCSYPETGALSLAFVPTASPVEDGYTLDITIADPSDPKSFVTHSVMIDTGSTGLAVPAKFVPESVWKASSVLDQIGYSSSGNYYAGKKVRAVVSLPLRGGDHVSTTPIDVVAASCHCDVADTSPTSSAAVNPDRCESYNGTAPVNGKPGTSLGSCAPVGDRFGMIGVGFDRGQSPTNATNPFLNLPTVAHSGYVITQTGIDIGLTQQNTKNFQTIQLTPASPQPLGGTKVWNGANTCIALKESKDGPPLGAPLCGSTLVDTGLNYMFMAFADNVRPAGTVQEIQVPIPGTDKTKPESVVKLDLVMELTAPGLTINPTLVATQNPPKGSPPPGRSQANWIKPDNGNFINTGRFWLNKVSYMFDQSCGLIGFSQIAP